MSLNDSPTASNPPRRPTIAAGSTYMVTNVKAIIERPRVGNRRMNASKATPMTPIHATNTALPRDEKAANPSAKVVDPRAPAASAMAYIAICDHSASTPTSTKSTKEPTIANPAKPAEACSTPCVASAPMMTVTANVAMMIVARNPATIGGSDTIQLRLKSSHDRVKSAPNSVGAGAGPALSIDTPAPFAQRLEITASRSTGGLNGC